MSSFRVKRSMPADFDEPIVELNIAGIHHQEAAQQRPPEHRGAGSSTVAGWLAEERQAQTRGGGRGWSSPSKRARIYGHPKLLGGTSRRGRKVVLDSDDEDDSAVQQPKEETEENSSGSASSPRKPVINNDEEETAVPEPKESTEENSSGSASSPRKSASDSDNTADTTPPATSTPDTGDEAAESSTNTNQASEEVSKKSTRLTEKDNRSVSGLLNNSQQCFANSVIQLFDAALDGHNLNAVLGEVGPVHPFKHPDIDPDDKLEYVDTTKTRQSKAKKPAKKPAKKQPDEPEQDPTVSKLAKLKAAIKDRIHKSTKAGKLSHMSPKKHLRSLIHYMRGCRGSKKWVTPFLFQQILAYGDENASRSREHLDGVEQQDCYECYQAVLDGVTSSASDKPDDASTNATLKKSLFDITSETATVCSNPDCDHKGEATAVTSHSISISVPKQKEAQLMDLLEASNASELDIACPKCGQETLERRTEFREASDNFVLHLNRIGLDGSTKIRTPVKLPLKEIEIAGKQFVLNSVVRHKGYTANHGYYTVLRRRSPGWTTSHKSLWFQFDDDLVTPVEVSQVKDHGRKGESALLLFKAL